MYRAIRKAAERYRGAGLRLPLAAVLTGTAIYGMAAPFLLAAMTRSGLATLFWIGNAILVGAIAGGALLALAIHRLDAARDAAGSAVMKAELAGALANAEIAIEEKRSFIAEISHELRTPMNGVIGFTEVLLAGDIDLPTRQSLEMLADSGRSMVTLLDALLEGAKIDFGPSKPKLETFDPKRELEGVRAILAPVAARKSVEMQLQVDETVPDWIKSDPLRLRQIVHNVLANAVKFTDHGRIDIDVAVSLEPANLHIKVTDTGIGIATDKLDHIFGKFAQADNTIDQRYGGTGLGLPICAKLAEVLGGNISVESELGKGSTFTIVIPFEPASQPETTTPAGAERGLDREAFPNLRVLLVEDSVINQQVMLAMLSHLGLKATIATDGQEAVDLVLDVHGTKEAFDLVLMDLQLPRLDGRSAAQAIRLAGVDAHTLPIIAVTASALAQEAEASLASGMQDHLSKPFSLGELGEVLRKWIGGGYATAEVLRERAPSAKLVESFAQRKANALVAIDESLRSGTLEGCSLDQLARLIHQISGVAAFFGEADLGATCSKLDEQLRNNPELVAPADLHRVRELLRA